MSLTSNQKVKSMTGDNLDVSEVEDAEYVDATSIEDNSAEAANENEDSNTSEDSAGVEAPKEKDWREERLAQVTHKQHRAEEKIREQEVELAKLRQSAVPESTEVVVPDYPDMDLRYDNPEEFDRQLAVRDAALQSKASADYAARAKGDADLRATQERNNKAQEELKIVVDAYTAKGVESGISTDKMAYNEEVLASHGVGVDLAQYLYSDANGAQIVDYLASNTPELTKLQSMTPYQAVEYIATNVKGKAKGGKSKATKTPDPIVSTKGSGAAKRGDYDTDLNAGYSFN